MNNNKNSILLVDPEFDPNTASDCDLLLKITCDSFSYAVINKNSRQLKAVFDRQRCEDTPGELASALKRDSYLQLPFRKIKVSVYTPNTLAVPNELFDKTELNSYANFFTEEASNHIYIAPFAKFGFTSVFNLEQFVEDTLQQSLAGASMYEHNAPLLTLAPDAEGMLLLLDFTAASVNALLMDTDKVIFQNSFQIDTPDEFNYYLLLLIRELDLTAACSTVMLSGIIHKDDAYYTCLSKYFTDLRFNLPKADLIDQTILDDLPSHYYSSLLALDLCV